MLFAAFLSKISETSYLSSSFWFNYCPITGSWILLLNRFFSLKYSFFAMKIRYVWVACPHGYCNLPSLFFSLPRFKYTGDIKGFAFIEFETPNEAEKAVQVSHRCFSREITVRGGTICIAWYLQCVVICFSHPLFWSKLISIINWILGGVECITKVTW